MLAPAASLLLVPLMLLSQGEQRKADDLEAQRLSVVKVRAHRQQGSGESAAAVYVGKDQQYAYFATAYHAVSPEKTPIQSVDIQFYTSPQRFSATVLAQLDKALDLAVLQTGLSNVPTTLLQLTAKDAVADTAIHIIGHPSAGDWSIWTGHIQNENSPQGDVHHFTISRDESLADGYSGGPVFDSRGNLFGIHTATVANYGTELKILEMLAELKAWRVPTNGILPPGMEPNQNHSGTSLDTGRNTGSSAAAARAWQLIENSTEPRDFDTFAREFSSDPLAHLAAVRAGQLRAKLEQDAQDKKQDRDDQMAKCYAVAKASCMRSCVNQYHFDRTDCLSNFCSLKKNDKYWKEVCTNDIDGKGKRF